MTDLTAPVYADTLGGMVALVEQFDGFHEWSLLADPDGPRMVARWNILTIAVRERSDLELARFIAAERTRARQALDRITMAARAELGWGRGEPWVRCVVCRVNDRASRQHTPGGPDCHTTREDRRLAHSE
jgi:hypothetical protein